MSIAHEVAHIKLGHLEKKKQMSIARRLFGRALRDKTQVQWETEADAKAYREGYDIPALLLHWYAKFPNNKEIQLRMKAIAGIRR